MKTNMKKTFIAAAATGLLVLGATTIASDAEAKGDKEKCYGVAKAGANDCANKAGTHSCAGQSTVDGDAGEFIVLPKGLCDRLANGSTS